MVNGFFWVGVEGEIHFSPTDQLRIDPRNPGLLLLFLKKRDLGRLQSLERFWRLWEGQSVACRRWVAVWLPGPMVDFSPTGIQLPVTSVAVWSRATWSANRKTTAVARWIGNMTGDFWRLLRHDLKEDGQKEAAVWTKTGVVAEATFKPHPFALRHFWGNTAVSPKKNHTQHSGTRPKASETWGQQQNPRYPAFFFSCMLLFFLLVLEHGIFIENYFRDMSLQQNDLVKY